VVAAGANTRPTALNFLMSIPLLCFVLPGGWFPLHMCELIQCLRTVDIGGVGSRCACRCDQVGIGSG
jgi:hypothetical protein